MNEKIKQEAALAMKFISRLNVSGDAVDVAAALGSTKRASSLLASPVPSRLRQD